MKEMVKEMKEVNGKVYPMWQQFLDQKDKWIGGMLQDFGDSMDRRMGYEGEKATISDITLEPNGEDSAFFGVHTDKGLFGFDVSVGGIGGDKEHPWLTFSGYGGHKFRIKKLS